MADGDGSGMRGRCRAARCRRRLRRLPAGPHRRRDNLLAEPVAAPRAGGARLAALVALDVAAADRELPGRRARRVAALGCEFKATASAASAGLRLRPRSRVRFADYRGRGASPASSARSTSCRQQRRLRVRRWREPLPVGRRVALCALPFARALDLACARGGAGPGRAAGPRRSAAAVCRASREIQTPMPTKTSTPPPMRATASVLLPRVVVGRRRLGRRCGAGRAERRPGGRRPADGGGEVARSMR